jgi:hypothetical protein
VFSDEMLMMCNVLKEETNLFECFVPCFALLLGDQLRMRV